MRAECVDALKATREVAQRFADAHDNDGSFPTEALTAMRETGLLGLMVPADHGGGDGSLADLVGATVELGRADTSVALIFAMHCQQVVTLARFGGERLRWEVLPDVAKGAMYLASVTTEVGKGGHLLSSESPTDHDGEALHIDRRAPVVTGGLHADGFLMTVQTPGASAPDQVDLVFARRDQVRLDVLGGWRSLGMRATQSVPMRLTGSVPAWQVVGEPGGFRAIAATVFAPLAHVGWAAAWLGTTAGALSRVVTHLRTERSVDPSAELLRARLASVRGRIDVVHAMLSHTVRVLKRDEIGSVPGQLLVNAVKVRAAQECYRAVDELIELVGLRHGYMLGSPLRLERALRDLRSASLNYSDDRLRLTNGALVFMDSKVRLVGADALL